MKKFLLIITVVVVLGVIYAWRYNSLINELQGNRFFSDQLPQDNPASALLTHEQYIQLGLVESGIKNLSLYSNHPLQKPPGVVRIGIFGGSMALSGGRTQKRDYTYPGLLQEDFKEHGLNRVEVINFGIWAYGMTQEYMLWKYLGQKYDLDYVVFTIHDYPHHRDNTFNNAANLSMPLHGRYIMDHGNLRFIPIAGESRQEAYKLYQSGIPRLRYLLYDRNIPVALKLFLPQSLYTRVNPFYYRHDQFEYQEVYSIYEALLRDVARRAKHVIIVANQSDSNELSKIVKASNVHIFTPSYQNILEQFPYYLEDLGHTGTLGNALIADELFSYLTGKETWKGVSLQLTPCLRACKAQGAGITGELSDYDRFNIRSGDTIIARMVNVNMKKFLKKIMGKRLPDDNKIRSFLMLPSVDNRIVVFIPLLFNLQEGQKVFLSFRAGWEDRSLFIGTVHAFNKIVGEMESTKCKFSSFLNLYFMKMKTFLILEDKDISTQLQGVTEGDIIINNSKVLKVKMSGDGLDIFGSGPRDSSRTIFKVQDDKQVFLAPEDSRFFKNNPFDPNGGTVDFVASKRDGEQQRCPIFSYQFVPFDEPISKPYKELMQELNNGNFKS